MQLVDVPVLNPGCCFICNSRNEGRWIDTLVTFEPGGPTPLNGRKYVCEGCGSEFAKLLGFEKSEDQANAVSRAEAAEAALGALQQRVQDFAVALASEVPEIVAESVEPVVDPVTKAPRKRTTAKKASA